MKLTVSVTQEDINLGCRVQAKHCPVARAVGRALTEQGYKLVKVSVCSASMHVWRMGAISSTPVVVPGSVARFITQFDRGREVSPFSFYLDIPWAERRLKLGIPVPADMMAVAIKETVCESK